MTVRIVTWNVNGIRNPFKYSPWNKDRTLQSMFDLLEADIVCFQEVKTPKASLTDDLVFVDGWDTFYSFPHSLTGYSGVAVYTRDSKCVPLRIEEGVTGILKIPGTQTRYVDAPATKQIGGYPTDRQLRRAAVGRDVIDSEGRCLILEFPLFVLINVYCPARRNHERTGFRNTFLLALDVRIRNLAAAGKNVVLCGDLNITRDQIDTAGIWGHQGQKSIPDALEFDATYMTMRAPKLLNQLLFNSRTISDLGTPFVDEAIETVRPPVLYDTGRELHPTRVGMFTCWDTRKNHRPANFGSRIDLVVCSPKVMQLVQEAEIQPHFHGSDHCPVYVVLRETIEDDSEREERKAETGDGDSENRTLHILDYLNPPGRFINGKNVLPGEEDKALLKKRFPQSGRRMAQFANRRHIASMFQRASKPSTPLTLAKTADESQQGNVAADAETTLELPAVLKADVVELVESDDEDGAAGMIEDDDEPEIVEEDERLESDTVSITASKWTTAKATQPFDPPQDRNNDDRGSHTPNPALSPAHANDTSSAMSSLPSRSAHIADARPVPPAKDTNNLDDDKTSESHENKNFSSAVHGPGHETPPDSLPFERETPFVAETFTPDSTAKPSQIQACWGDQYGEEEATRERGSETTEKASGASSLAWPLSAPTPKLSAPISLTPPATTTRHSLARSQSGAGSLSASQSSTAAASPTSARPAKKAKTSSSSAAASSSSSSGFQMSMNMFLTARPAKDKDVPPLKPSQEAVAPGKESSSIVDESSPVPATTTTSTTATASTDNDDNMWMTAEEVDAAFKNLDAAKASWSRLGLGQRQAPLCEHGEPCKTFVTKKAGVNSGRSFYMCARPPGPLGKREKGTSWQCTTFVWCRDWRPNRPD
ncbi:Class II abasic (AP) endonuclease [Sporothrix bragantina]|uniref:DNA-(apurinic or apyrimidinic site) endonuclease 2 n=1 Tax=Sporothrix bragantina TaxID=671064 RepID=A0ABP0CU95_9PEZI